MKEIQDLKTQLTIVVGFSVLSFIFNADILTYLALGLGLTFLISKTLTKYILWLWWKIAHVLGWINTRILLSLVFYLFLLPIAFLSRIFTKDPLNLKWSKKGSTFIVRDHLYKPEDLENPW